MNPRQQDFRTHTQDLGISLPNAPTKVSRAINPRAPSTAPSTREYPRRAPVVLYSDTAAIRRVSSAGTVRIRGAPYFLTRGLTGEYVSLTETGGDRLTVAYGPLQLGEIDLTTNRFDADVRWVLTLTPGA